MRFPMEGLRSGVILGCLLLAGTAAAQERANTLEIGMNEQLFEDIFDCIEQAKGPAIVNDVIGSLRGSMSGQYFLKSNRRWRIGGNQSDFVRKLKEAGFTVKARHHGAGIAVYVHHSDFSTVKDRWGKDKEVFSY